VIYGFLRRGRGELVWTDLIGGTRTTGNGYPTLIVPIKRGKRAPRKALAKGVVRARDGEGHRAGKTPRKAAGRVNAGQGWLPAYQVPEVAGGVGQNVRTGRCGPRSVSPEGTEKERRSHNRHPGRPAEQPGGRFGQKTSMKKGCFIDVMISA